MKRSILEFFALQDMLYDMKANSNSLSWLLTAYIFSEYLNGLHSNPDYFMNTEEYQRYLKDQDIEYNIRIYNKSTYHNLNNDNIRNVLYQENSKRVQNKIRNQIIENPYVPNSTTVNFSNQRLKDKVTNMYVDSQLDSVGNQINSLRNHPVTASEVKEVSNALRDATRRVNSGNEKLREHIKKVRRLNEQLDRQADQSISYDSFLNRKDEEKPKWKVWIWHPNERTRHSEMDHVKVPFMDLFRVQSDQVGCPDCYMKHPLDSDGLVCQVANCQCTVQYLDSDGKVMRK